jgi:hypothetical protein
MKKIYTLLLLFTITLFYSIPTEAYTLNDNDIPVVALGGLTLNQVFRDGQLIANGNFNLGTSGYTVITLSGTVSDGIYNATATAQFGRVITSTLAPSGVVLYSITRFRVSAATNTVVFITNNPTTLQYHNVPGTFQFFSNLKTTTATLQNTRIEDTRTSGFSLIEIDFIYFYNITFLGLTSLTLNQLDGYFRLWYENNSYIEGFNDGFDDTLTYELGYALGLSQGADMETGSSLLILIVALIGFVMMIFGFTTKRGIFNLLSVAAFVVLGGLLIEFVGFIIITFGLVLINIYYAFFGEL